jgi:hypothetical protein
VAVTESEPGGAVVAVQVPDPLTRVAVHCTTLPMAKATDPVGATWDAHAPATVVL